MDIEKQKELEVLLEFIKLCSNGSVRPYDHSHFLYQIKKSNLPLSGEELFKCCPPSSEVRDAKDFKPYMMAAVRKVADLLKLDVDEIG